MKMIVGNSWFFRRLMFWIRAFLGTANAKETYMAQKFNSTIVDSPWLKYRSISPGGFAVDYHFFYTLYRTLSAVKPKNILEFGLGQTSKMVHQYAGYYDKRAVSVEHDKDWISFFDEERDGDYPIHTKLFELETIKYNGYDTSVYKGSLDYFKGRGERFDFFLVDGPLRRNPVTQKEYKYVRAQIVDFVNYCLDDNFVILFDDYNYEGVRNTVNEVFKCLDKLGVNYVYRIYYSSKAHIIITTPKHKFLTSL